MSGFQENLDEEIEKRRSDGAAVDDTPEIAFQNKQKNFSLKTFALGLLICLIALSGLVGWAWLQTDKTNKALRAKLPSKTTIVEIMEEGVHSSDIQTTLTMPQHKKEETIETAHHKPAKHTEKETAHHTADIPDGASQIIENTTYGMLPKVDQETGVKPHRVYQASFTKQGHKPLLSFVINDLGLSSKRTAAIIENVSSEISLSFSPYAHDLESQTEAARKDGHEIWLSLPLETKEYPLNDPGPSTLLVNASTEKNTVRLRQILGKTIGYVGFISQPNHVFKPEDASVNPAIKEIFTRGLAVIDGNMSLRSFIGGMADRNDYPYAQTTLWLDNNLTPLSLKQNIRKITEYGANGKNVIVMLHPYPASLKAMNKFLNSKAANQFELAPASAQLINK